jgi:hypothetical protein
LKKQRRKAQELTYDALLDDVLLTADLAREAGQHAASLTGLRMLGGELYHAFTERKEVVNLEVQAKSKAELKQLLIDDFGADLAEQIWQSWGAKPKLIEGNAIETDHQEPSRSVSTGGMLCCQSQRTAPRRRYAERV